jgi:hypothetical protein
MNKEEIIQIMLDGVIEDMKYIYTNASISEEESTQHLEQGQMSFQYICNNMYNRLVEKSIINP